MDNIIAIKKLSVQRGQTQVLSSVSCQIEAGDFVGLVGPNGGGKTTLAKTILGLVPVHSGQISLFGQGINTFRDFHRIGYLPQKHDSINPLFPATSEEVVMLGLLAGKSLPKRVTRDDWLAVDKLLQELGIMNLKGKLISDLSGGQQQKILLARALASEPELLILDEPSTALDPSSREQFFARLKKLNTEKKTTIILITHDTGYIGEYANKLLYLDRELVFFGQIADFCPGEEIESCFEKHGQHIIWHQHK